jgi:hypothetical protein
VIIQIRGTHGSGKSTLVRTILLEYIALGSGVPFHAEGRKRPVGYRCEAPGRKPLWIMGSYETPTGGCDTIPDMEMMYSIIKRQASAGYNVLFEGILAQHSAPRILDLKKDHQVQLIVLTTPVAQCIDGVNQRREERGSKKPLDPSNLEREARSVLSSMKRLRGEGVSVLELSRDAAFYHVKSLLTV